MHAYRKDTEEQQENHAEVRILLKLRNIHARATPAIRNSITCSPLYAKTIVTDTADTAATAAR